ncbi:DUF1292 domain-containing protein [Sporolituus thermophilus]|uniref:DUF1292 domain-containing protein n=1 Tax=Sporolituus thermophilus TaxID=608505 RepID=UPI003CCC0A89
MKKLADIERDDNLGEFEIIEFEDEEGNKEQFIQEMIIEIGEKRFAILVPFNEEEDCCCEGEPCDCDEEGTDAFIARIDKGEDGEDIYVDPTDEEYEQVLQAYEELLEEETEA